MWRVNRHHSFIYRLILSPLGILLGVLSINYSHTICCVLLFCSLYCIDCRTPVPEPLPNDISNPAVFVLAASFFFRDYNPICLFYDTRYFYFLEIRSRVKNDGLSILLLDECIHICDLDRKLLFFPVISAVFLGLVEYRIL